MSVAKPIAMVDTDVVSYLLKGDAIAWEYSRLLQGYKSAVSAITAGELRFGSLRRDIGPRRMLHLNEFLAECLVIPIAAGMDRVYAEVMFERQRMGRRLEKADGWIATTV